METLFFVYIMTNKPNGILYIGMTNDLIRRVFEHKNKFVKGFTEKYGLDSWYIMKCAMTRKRLFTGKNA